MPSDLLTPRQEIVLVSGPPGSGKTMLAVPLAARLGFAFIAKDDIKETMFSATQGVDVDALALEVASLLAAARPS